MSADTCFCCSIIPGYLFGGYSQSLPFYVCTATNQSVWVLPKEAANQNVSLDCVWASASEARDCCIALASRAAAWALGILSVLAVAATIELPGYLEQYIRLRRSTCVRVFCAYMFVLRVCMADA
jgi:hypothetical protein